MLLIFFYFSHSPFENQLWLTWCSDQVYTAMTVVIKICQQIYLIFSFFISYYCNVSFIVNLVLYNYVTKPTLPGGNRNFQRKPTTFSTRIKTTISKRWSLQFLLNNVHLRHNIHLRHITLAQHTLVKLHVGIFKFDFV